MKVIPETSHCIMYGFHVKLSWTEIPFSFNGEISYRCPGSVWNHGSGYLLSRAVRGQYNHVYCPGIVICKICFTCRLILWIFYTLISVCFCLCFICVNVQSVKKTVIFQNNRSIQCTLVIFIFCIRIHVPIYKSYWSMKKIDIHFLRKFLKSIFKR